MRAAADAFDELADAYDRFRTGYASEVYDALFAYGLASDARVLDAGCGTGLASCELIERGCRVVGVDPSSAMIARARSRVPQATFTTAHAEALPFANGTFDSVACAQAFHWFDRRRALAEFARVVRPGGIVAIWWKNLLRGDMTRLAREAVARELALDVLPDSGPTPFEEFAGDSLGDCRLRIIPSIVHVRTSDFLGCERSRAGLRVAYGDRTDAYFARLEARLARADGEIALSYLHVLYLGRVGGSEGNS